MVCIYLYVNISLLLSIIQQNIMNFVKKHGIKEYSYQTILSKLREPIEDIEGFSLVLKKGGHHEGEYTISTSFWDSLVKELHEFLGSGK